MSWFHGIRHRFGDLVRPDQRDRELDEEIRYHLELEAVRLIAAGLSPESARARALARFGNPSQVAQRTRDRRDSNFIGESMQDLRWVIRSLLRSPGFTFVAV